MFVEGYWNGSDVDTMFGVLSDGTSSNRIHFGYDSGDNWIYALIKNGGVIQVLITQTGNSAGWFKLAFAYKANDFAFYINGTQIGTDTSGSVPACSRVDVGNYFSSGFTLGGGIKQYLIFKTRLTNAELATLTTL